MSGLSANLQIEPAVTQAFAAMDARALHLAISGESIVLEKTLGSLSNDTSSEFDALQTQVSTDEAKFILFNLGSPVNKWLLVAWVPDMAQVRSKMLYSSSKDHVKKTLGLTSFKGDYYANDVADLKWDSYSASLVKVVSLNEREEVLEQEKQDKIADGGGQVTAGAAMGVVPFSLTSEATAQLTKFKSGELHFVSLGLGAECTINVSEGFDASGVNIVGAVGSAPLASKLVQTSPSFVCVRCAGPIAGSTVEVFVYSCPENSPVRTKMSFSTAKSAALSEMKRVGVVFEKNFEITETSEVDDVLKTIVEGEKSGASSAAAEIKHKKPSRPGKGRARQIKKFVPDDP
ncbi:hypothetical protein TrVE_jg6734 [Triparma verrucosa]|uniref:ADF-H domain-containing protein n=1 Tax=Triparma verrucosa TaxID=1606542 RepID=A0A9W7BKR0_9STRA|nr:hypothetical protein TrVE_jg6734 [Triparma verrucosa]